MAKKDDKMEMMGGMCQCCSGPWCVLSKVVILIVAPAAFIWALNHLFSVAIAYTVWTWLAALVLLALFTRRIGRCVCCNGCSCGMGMMKK